jgi:hypothetical protein
MIGASKDQPRGGCNFSQWGAEQIKGRYQKYWTKTIWLIENHPLELWHIKIELKTSQELIWDFIEKKMFWYHETTATSLHAKESEIDRSYRQIDELCQFQEKEPSDEGTKHVVFEYEYFGWGGVPLKNYGNHCFQHSRFSSSASGLYFLSKFESLNKQLSLSASSYFAYTNYIDWL